jgi:hypothetical protein
MILMISFVCEFELIYINPDLMIKVRFFTVIGLGGQWLFQVCLDQSGSALAGLNRWKVELSW